jgi:hypothetical protein
MGTPNYWERLKDSCFGPAGMRIFAPSDKR